MSAPGDAEFAALLAGLEIVLQPIIDASTGDVFAYEALARFAGGQSAESAIALADELGRLVDFELACARLAVARRGDLPPDVLLSVNISPDALRAASEQDHAFPTLAGIIVEVTEHAAGQPDALARDVASLRARGALVAVDDVGTGYAGLLRLASLGPDIVKIDKSIVTGLRHSVNQAAVLESLVALSHRIGATVIAEGVEGGDDLSALARFDVDYAQGWLIGRPERHLAAIPDDVVSICRRSRASVLGPGSAGAGAAGEARTMHEATSLLGLATEFAHLTDAVVASARALSVDIVGLSMLDADGHLRELVSSGIYLDNVAYPLDDYPASREAITTGRPVEVHVSDHHGDPAEQSIMRSIGCQSLLIVPVGAPGRPVGILEFFQRTHRRWTTVDVAQGRGLALHVATTLQRLAPSAAVVTAATSCLPDA